MVVFSLVIGTAVVLVGIAMVYYLSGKDQPRKEYLWVGSGKNPVKHMKY